MVSIDSDENCELAAPLNTLHIFLHGTLPEMNEQERDGAHELAQKILQLLNEEKVTNRVKLMALYAVVATGVEVIKDDVKILKYLSNEVQ